jgi:hypothetical protein
MPRMSTKFEAKTTPKEPLQHSPALLGFCIKQERQYKIKPKERL